MSDDLTKGEVSAVAQKAGCAWLHEPLAQRFATLCRAPLVAELEQAKKDAERYRWLREGNDAKHGAAWYVAVNLYGCEWDAAIDAAIAKEQS